MTKDATPGQEPAAPPRRTRARSVQDRRARNRRLFTWGMAGVFGILVVNTLIGESGYVTLYQLRREEAALRSQVTRTRVENSRLQEESRRLRTDPEAVADRARRDLGLAAPGETVVIVREAATPTAPAEPAASPTTR